MIGKIVANGMDFSDNIYNYFNILHKLICLRK